MDRNSRSAPAGRQAGRPAGRRTHTPRGCTCGARRQLENKRSEQSYKNNQETQACTSALESNLTVRQTPLDHTLKSPESLSHPIDWSVQPSNQAVAPPGSRSHHALHQSTRMGPSATGAGAAMAGRPGISRLSPAAATCLWLRLRQQACRPKARRDRVGHPPTAGAGRGAGGGPRLGSASGHGRVISVIFRRRQSHIVSHTH